MGGSIHQALSQIKKNVAEALDVRTIERICETVGHVWRERELGPVATLHGFLLQVVHGNTACSNVPRLLGKNVTAKAYVLARSRLPLQIFERLLAEICSRLQGCVNDTGRWLGHRVWVMDGSGCSMPDTPELQKTFGQPGLQAKGCGFPVGHLMALFHVGTGMLMRVRLAPHRTHDMALAKHMHGELQSGDIVLADRGFSSFGHLAVLAGMGVYAVLRGHQTRVVSFRKGRPHIRSGKTQPHGRVLPTSRWIRRLGRHDQIVEYIKSPQRSKWLTTDEWDRLPAAIRVRELRYTLAAKGYRSRAVTVVTTLLDEQQYPANVIADLYAQRWQVETNLRHLKITLGMDVLRTKTVDGVFKELAMFSIAYNLVRLVMLDAAAQHDVPPDRISFTSALRWLRYAEPGDTTATILVLPERPGRFEPRVRKRRPKQYPPMTKPRPVLLQALATQRLTS